MRQLASILPDERPSVVVIDEVPYLMDHVDAFEGLLQRAWDRELSRRPVLLVLIAYRPRSRSSRAADDGSVRPPAA